MLLGSSLLCQLLRHGGLLFGAWQTFKVLKPRLPAAPSSSSSSARSPGLRRAVSLGVRSPPSSALGVRSPPGASALGVRSPPAPSAPLGGGGASEAHRKILAASYDDEAGKAMLAYWAVLSALAVYEWTGEWALSWVPLYFEAKAAVLLWLVAGVAARCMGLHAFHASLPKFSGAALPQRGARGRRAAGGGGGAGDGAGAGGGGGDAPVTLSARGLDGAVVLFSSALHPAMAWGDRMLDKVVLPRCATWAAR